MYSVLMINTVFMLKRIGIVSRIFFFLNPLLQRVTDSVVLAVFGQFPVLF